MEPTPASGTIRHDPERRLVAMRTELPEPRSWFVGTVDQGGHYADAAEVDGWPTLFAPDTSS